MADVKLWKVRRLARRNGLETYEFWSHDRWEPLHMDGEAMTYAQAERCLEQVKPGSQQDPDVISHAIVHA
jgi:hypothetical protein